ncbi:MAG TPA: DUF456 domain-containing protein [Candidatus Paceibacterota bacterium]
MNQLVLLSITILIMVPGIAGVFIPIIPGIPYMFFIALLYGIADRFQTLSLSNVLFLGLIVLFGLVVDYLSGTLGAHIGGASRRSLLFGLAGAVVGLLLMPPFGGIIGVVVGVAFGEYMHKKKMHEIAKSAVGALVGVLTGMSINFTLALVFFISFVPFAIK